MARAGMLHKGSKNGAEGCDDVQRSLELLDQVLSEYDEGEPRSLEVLIAATPATPETPATPTTPATPATPATDDDSPLAGHTSEDDGYMSMNGRRAKFALGFCPTEEREEPSMKDVAVHQPPPPEEAERIISTLLPKISPVNSANKKNKLQQKEAEEKFDSIISVNGGVNTTQTTFPKTRHQRPYGWEKENEQVEHVQPVLEPTFKFSSLQHGVRAPNTDGGPPNWLPQRNHIPTTPPKISPTTDKQTMFPFMGFSSEFNDKPYNEHPITIYPGPNKQFKQLLSPNNVAKGNQTNKDSWKSSPLGWDSKSDGEILSPVKIPPLTLAGSMERHREVCRGSSEDIVNFKTRCSINRSDEEHFSDDSLEESLPPPPPPAAVTTPSKRNSIAWEVSLDGDPLLTPGSTKVIGRRRRKSGDQSNSSSSSIPQRVDEDEYAEEYWPPPPPHMQGDPLGSPSSDADGRRLSDNSSGTYVIRKGKSRKQLPNFQKNSANKQKLLQNHNLNRSIDTEKSVDGSSISISGSGSVGSYNSRPSSDLSLPQSRHSFDINSRLSRELNTPNSRYSIDLGSNSILSKEMVSPKSRLSLDLNNSQEKYVISEFFGHSPRSKKNASPDRAFQSKNSTSLSSHNKLSPQNRLNDIKKYSSTFDNIKSLMKESKMEEVSQLTYNETVNELPAASPNMVRVVSLPALGAENEGAVSSSRQALSTTVEEEEEHDSAEPESSGETSPLRKIENNINAILCQGRDQNHFTPYLPKDWNIHKDEYCDDIPKDIADNKYRYSSRERQKRNDIQKSSSHNEIQTQRSIERRISSRRSNSMHKSTSSKDVPVSLMRQPSSSDSAVSSGGDFPLNVHIVEHSYRHHPLPPSPSMAQELGPLPQTPESPNLPPLPPSPVQEVDDEYSEILQTNEKRQINMVDKIRTPTLDFRRRPSEPPAVPPHRDTTNSLKTRSMETSYSKNRRNSGNLKSGSTDRRTLPTDMGASGARRRTLQRQSRDMVGGGIRGPLQTSASLPETPVFARGCDVPRTPPRNSIGPPRNNTLNSRQGGSATLGCYGRGSIMGPAGTCTTGADLLRMGGPARGWYPRQRFRPASIEHLDRLTATTKSAEAATWDGSGARKPLTLPPNLTPKFFHKSPREALRRVTSLLIRKGNNGKDKDSSKSKEATSPAARSANGDDHPGQKQRKGFFRSFWKKSRHYSLEHP